VYKIITELKKEARGPVRAARTIEKKAVLYRVIRLVPFSTESPKCIGLRLFLSTDMYLEIYANFVETAPSKMENIIIIFGVIIINFFKLAGWDFGYCGHYWPIVPDPDDR
jgi:hypothetical protein